MTREPGRGPDSDDRSRAVREAERRRRRARVFGDVLPEQTRDDESSDPSGDRSSDGPAGSSGSSGSSGSGSSGTSDEWLRSQVPPHHG